MPFYSPAKGKPFPYIGCAALLCTVVFWNLGGATFWDPDEAHYAQTTRELLATGDWTAPYYNQQPFFDKPIFFHWLQAVPMAALGDTEFAARLVPAVAAAALVVLTWWFGARTRKWEDGMLAGLLLAASPGVFTLARYAILDTVFTAFLFGGVAALAVAALYGPTWLQYVGYVSIGLATFTKGPVALVLSGLAFALSLALSREARAGLLRLRWVTGLGIAMLVASPWFLYMLKRFGPAFVDGYFLNENVLLFATSMYANQPPWWFYLGIIGLGLLPWTPLVAGRLFDHVAAAVRGTPVPVVDTVLWSWVATIVGFFSLSRFKLDHYVFPAAPALCLICARAWYDVQRPADGGEAAAGHGATADLPRAMPMAGARLGTKLIGPTLVVAGVVAGVLLVERLKLPPAALSVALALVGCGIVTSLRYSRRNPRPGAPVAALVALGFLYAGVLLWVMPAIEQGKVVPDVARWVRAHAAPEVRVATFRLNRWNTAFRFYVDRHTVTIESDEDARRFFSDSSPYYCVMTRPLFDALRKAGVPLAIVYDRQGLWVTSGRALWRQEAERTDFVVTAPARVSGGSR